MRLGAIIPGEFDDYQQLDLQCPTGADEIINPCLESLKQYSSRTATKPEWNNLLTDEIFNLLQNEMHQRAYSTFNELFLQNVPNETFSLVWSGAGRAVKMW